MGPLEKNNWFLLGLAGSMGYDPPDHSPSWRPLKSWPAAPGVGLETCLENQFGKAVSSMMSSICCIL